MRIDNHVGDDTLNCEWQVLLAIGHSTGTFLTVTTGKLVTNLGDLDRSHLDLDESQHLLVRGENDLVDIAFFRMLKRHRLVLVGFCVQLLLAKWVELILSHRGHFTNNDIITTDLCTRANDSVFVQLIVSAMAQSRCLGRVWTAELLFE